MFKRHITLAAILFTFGGLSTAQGLAFENLEAFPTNPTVQAPGGFYFEIKPGGEVTDSVTVKNLGETPISIRVYAAETDINNQGETVLKGYNDERKDFATWVTFNKEKEGTFELAPLTETNLEFQVKVPENTSLDLFKGGIMVERLNTSDKEIKENFVIKTNARIGLGTKLVVTDNPQPPEYIIPATPSTAWRQTYFYVSLGLFVVAVGVLTVTALKKRGKKRK